MTPARLPSGKESVLATQEAMHRLEARKRELEEELDILKAEIDLAIAEHRAQIARSINSKDPEERSMARGVATFWDVPLPDTTDE